MKGRWWSWDEEKESLIDGKGIEGRRKKKEERKRKKKRRKRVGRGGGT